MTERNTVRVVFDHLRLTLETEIPRQLEHPEGGHYVVALLVAIGSEALSRLQGQPAEHLFVKMTTQHGLTERMASTLFDALRHGIAHLYDTKYIKAGSLMIELSVSWRLKKHLSSRPDPPCLYLNVRTMWGDLQAELARLADSLPAGGALPPEWSKGSSQPADHDAAAWREWIATHKGRGHPMIAAIYARKSTDQTFPAAWGVLRIHILRRRFSAASIRSGDTSTRTFPATKRTVRAMRSSTAPNSDCPPM